MKSFNALTSFSLFSLHALPVSAYWRMACGVSQTSRMDPILSPGAISGHVHKFAGGNNVNQFSTHASLIDSTCSTCEVQSDKSAYWTPQLYYQHADGTIEEVQNDGMTVYYVGRGGNSSNTVPFPDGFKMISGDSLRRSYNEQDLTYLNTRPIADRVSFRCINDANNIPETHYLSQTNCVNGLRAQLNFQSCWDGVNLYSPGSTHVAYLSGIDYGVCPPSHPVPIPGLFFEVLYWTNRINQSKGGRFVFSNGDATGFGFHGDFMNGWDQDAQVRAVQQCLYTDNGGNVLACPALAESANPDFARICPASPSVFSEIVQGVLPEKRLPGCNPISTGPTDIQQIACPASSTSSVGQSSLVSSSSSSSSSTSSSRTSSSSFSSSSSVSSSSSSSSFSSSSRVALSSTTSQMRASTTFNSSAPSTTLTTKATVGLSDASSTTPSSFSSTTISGNRQSPGVFVTASTDTSTLDFATSQNLNTTTATSAFSTGTETSSVASITSSTFAPVVLFNSTEVVVVGNVTVTTVIVRTSTLSPSEYCSMFSTASLEACETATTDADSTLATTTDADASTETGAETQTAFVTVYSPLTLNVTSITDVTITATPPAKLRRSAEAVTYRLRGRQIIKRRA